MKNTILWGALLTLICTQVQADVTQPTTQPQMPSSTTVVPTTTPSANQVAPTAQPTQAPQLNQPTQQVPSTQQNQPIQSPQNIQQVPVPQQTSPEIAPVQAQPVQAINCDYKIPAEIKKIDQSLVLTWSEKAVLQAFDFDPTNIDTQIQKLQACFTEQGWTGFNTALQKSGNIEAIKSQKLTVSSQVDGQTQVADAKDNQWKITLPLQVVYQNDKEKVTQLLNINLTIGRKMNGDLGIMQLIATPRPTVTPAPTTSTDITTTPTPTVTNAPTSDVTTQPAVPVTPTTPSDVTPPVNPTDVQTPSTGSSINPPNTPN